MLKADFAILKLEVDKLDLDKLKAVPVDLRKLSNIVGNGVVKRAVFDKLVNNINAIDTNGFKNSI